MQIIISSIIMKKHYKYYVEKLKVNSSHKNLTYFFNYLWQLANKSN